MTYNVKQNEFIAPFLLEWFQTIIICHPRHASPIIRITVASLTERFRKNTFMYFRNTGSFQFFLTTVTFHLQNKPSVQQQQLYEQQQQQSLQCPRSSPESSSPSHRGPMTTTPIAISPIGGMSSSSSATAATSEEVSEERAKGLLPLVALPKQILKVLV